MQHAFISKMTKYCAQAFEKLQDWRWRLAGLVEASAFGITPIRACQSTKAFIRPKSPIANRNGTGLFTTYALVPRLLLFAANCGHGLRFVLRDRCFPIADV